jgi:hypothetical protein
LLKEGAGLFAEGRLSNSFRLALLACWVGLGSLSLPDEDYDQLHLPSFLSILPSFFFILPIDSEGYPYWLY